MSFLGLGLKTISNWSGYKDFFLAVVIKPSANSEVPGYSVENKTYMDFSQPFTEPVDVVIHRCSDGKEFVTLQLDDRKAIEESQQLINGEYLNAPANFRVRVREFMDAPAGPGSLVGTDAEVILEVENTSTGVPPSSVATEASLSLTDSEYLDLLGPNVHGNLIETAPPLVDLFPPVDVFSTFF